MVESGIVLDALNRELVRDGLWFAPESATQDRTLGDMIGYD